ncbi:replication endonuclease [Colwellia sp. MB3u-55]|jgi:hypothetical protein|uniref:replication endonuclease n=1 Tax=Colwellia sp. MB3u-55 TaxID=2759810 RepID=UPI0015F497FE|nr:replication endonuclease [Colwellia sp. MB3u-55]MBA6251001.1 replication endonuclease [Colwellia sp. MB3u-55]
MSRILNKTKYYDSYLSYEAISKLSPIELVHFNDLMPISETIIQYFNENISKSEDDELLLLSPTDDNLKITLNLPVAFGLQLSRISGRKITAKLKTLLNKNHLCKKLNALRDVYKEVYFFVRSNSEYVTDITLSKFQIKNKLYDNAIKNNVLLSSSGSLSSLKNHVHSKKAQHLEFKNTIKELEILSRKTGKHWLSATITCPSIFHINPINKANSWDKKSTPLDANDFQNTVWENTLRKLSKLNIAPYGFWVKEANKSGAIHRHLLIYASEEELEITNKWLTHYTKSAFKKLKASFNKNSIKIKNSSSTNSTELSKETNYLFKTFNSKSTKITSKEAEKIAAHANKYNYRRFGFIGLQNSLGNWRLLKQFVNSKVNIRTPKHLKTLLNFARKNEFHKFLSTPLKDNLSKIINKNSYQKDKVVGFSFGSKEFIFKQRYSDLYEQLINYLSLNLFCMIKNKPICNR